MKDISGLFADWVRTMPRDERYSYWSISNCAVLRFIADTGVHDPCDRLFDSLHYSLGGALCTEPFTFGALADRLARQPIKEMVG